MRCEPRVAEVMASALSPSDSERQRIRCCSRTSAHTDRVRTRPPAALDPRDADVLVGVLALVAARAHLGGHGVGWLVGHVPDVQLEVEAEAGGAGLVAADLDRDDVVAGQQARRRGGDPDVAQRLVALEVGLGPARRPRAGRARGSSAAAGRR